MIPSYPQIIRAVPTLAALLAFALIPVWYRLKETPPLFSDVYVTRFLILLPMLVTIAGWLLQRAPGLRAFAQDRWRGAWAIVLLLLALWGFTSEMWAFIGRRYPEVAATAALQFGIMALFAVAVGCLVSDGRLHLRHVLLVPGIVLVGNSLLTALQVLRQGSLGLSAIGEFRYSEWASGLSIVQAAGRRFVRPYGLLPHPNLLAATLMVGTLAAMSWLGNARRWRRIAGVLLVGIGVGALLLTFSRAAWGGLLLGVIVMGALSVRHWRHLWARRGTFALIAVLLIVIGGLFILQYRPFLAARVGEGQESVELRSVSDRLVFTQMALRAIGERPLLGYGIGNFPWRASFYLSQTEFDLRGDNVHHVLLSAWAEQGTVGVVLYVAAIVTAAVSLLRALRRNFSPARLALVAIFAALTAVGWLDHYPYTLLHMQVAWWGLAAVGMSDNHIST